MKYLVLIGDGMADFPLEELGGRTPLETARTPAMDAVAQSGVCAQFCPIPEGFAPGSEIGNLSLFGYSPAETFTGRAPLEAASQGITLGAGEVAFRCNLVTLDDGLMKSFTAGHISNEEGAELIAALNAALSAGGVRLYPGVGYRNLAVIRADQAPLEALTAIECTPPHNVTDQPYEPALPMGEGSEFIRDLMARSRSVLAEHPVNAARAAAGHPPATSIWLWGQGRSPSLPTYQTQYGISGAVVSAVDLVKGIGRLAGLEVLEVDGATGYLDTNYEGKVAAALDALDRHDFAYLHIEAPDETAHEGRSDLKIQAIEDFDQRVVAPCLRYCTERGGCRLLVAPDHVTSIETKTHAPGPVPFAMCGEGVTGNGVTAYTEAAAAAQRHNQQAGHLLVQRMLRLERADAASLCA